MSNEGFREYNAVTQSAEHEIGYLNAAAGRFEDNGEHTALAVAMAGIAIARSIIALNYGIRLALNEMKNELA